MTNLREIVNGSNLPGFVGKNVSLIGHVEDKASNGMSFNLRTTDNLLIKVTLKSPVAQPLEGYVEVHGIANKQGITADEFIVFSNETFDAKGYNKLCTFLHTVQNLWKTS